MCAALTKQDVILSAHRSHAHYIAKGPYKDVIRNHYEQIYDGNVMQNKYGIDYLDNTPEEILNAVSDMDRKLTGNPPETSEEKALMKRYLNEFLILNKTTQAKTKICVGWLKRNIELYLD